MGIEVLHKVECWLCVTYIQEVLLVFVRTSFMNMMTYIHSEGLACICTYLLYRRYLLYEYDDLSPHRKCCGVGGEACTERAESQSILLCE